MLSELILFTIFLYIIICLFGITIGSFLNVCIYRIPKKENRGAAALPNSSMAPDARSMVTDVSSRIRVGISVINSFNPSDAPASSRS